MKRKSKEIDFVKEAEAEFAAIKSRIRKEVPLSNRYVRGQRAILISVDKERFLSLWMERPRRLDFPMEQRLLEFRSETWLMTEDTGSLKHRRCPITYSLERKKSENLLFRRRIDLSCHGPADNKWCWDAADQRHHHRRCNQSQGRIKC